MGLLLLLLSFAPSFNTCRRGTWPGKHHYRIDYSSHLDDPLAELTFAARTISVQLIPSGCWGQRYLQCSMCGSIFNSLQRYWSSSFCSLFLRTTSYLGVGSSSPSLSFIHSLTHSLTHSPTHRLFYFSFSSLLTFLHR